MNKKLIKKIAFKSIIIVIILIVFFSILINLSIIKNYSSEIYITQKAPEKQVGLILGAGVLQNNKTLSDIYRDRVDTALNLYKASKIEKILISGDNGDKSYNEVEPARDYLIEKGVKSKDIFLDYAGFRTYDSLYRARDVFKVTEVNLITQEFHLPRALYLCNKMGLDCVGTKADLHKYKAETRNNTREFFARVKSFLDITFHKKPKFLGPVVDINGESNAFKSES